MKKYLLPLLLLLAAPAFAAQQEITIVPDDPVIPSIGALKDAVNLRLADIDENFDELYPIIEAGPVYVNASAPADTKVVWIDTDQDNAIKINISGTWTVVGTVGGAGDNLGSAAYTDVVSLWTTCTGYLKSDGTCDTPSGSATYPSAAGVANWDGSAWGTSYTVGTAANNLVQLNASAQLPAVSGALLTNIPMPSWFPSSAPTADKQIIQATGGCSDAQYTDQSTCEGNSGTWTPPVSAWTSIIDGLINDAGTGTDDLLSASQIDTRISTTVAFYQEADGDLDTVAGADTAGNSKLFGTNSSGTPGWYDIPVATDEVVYMADCSTITNGACVDTDTGDLYYYDGSAVVAVPLGSTQPVAMQQVFASSETLVAGTGSKIKAITGAGWTTADIGCDASDTLGVSVKTSSTINGTYTEIGAVSLTAAAQKTAVDISSWANISAGTWVRIDLTGTPAAATECTIVIEGVEQ